eukprot:11635836-Ditylum_brightwellii.AAC.1
MDNIAIFSRFSLQLHQVANMITINGSSHNDDAMHFWKTLDLDWNVQIETLDAFESEAHQVYPMNLCITYSIPLQHIREWGYRSEVREKGTSKGIVIQRKAQK